jgi:myosin-crossreactive antigen
MGVVKAPLCIVYEELDVLGGCLDASGIPEVGDASRDGRMLGPPTHDPCMYDRFRNME